MPLTSVQISREASAMLDLAVKESGLRKGYLADTAIKFFLNPENNPGIGEALKSLTELREQAEAEFVNRVFNKGRGE